MRKIDGDVIEEAVLKLCHTDAYLMKVDLKVGMNHEDPLDPKPLKRNINQYNFNLDTYENKWTNQ